MRTHEQVVRTTVYTSEVIPVVSTENEELSAAIAWADANPIVWKIVMGTTSAPFGKNASTYLGCSRGDAPAAVLDRVAAFKAETERPEEDFHGWRARFTLAHHGEKGFKGGLFQQHDGTYNRGCSCLDYTPATLDEVVDRFLAWCGSTHLTVKVICEGKTVRTLVEPNPCCGAYGVGPGDDGLERCYGCGMH